MSVRLMEICGTHTMAIAESGIRSLIPEVSFVSGPGCPVCVTPVSVIDSILELSARPDVVIATYGDMMRVPGSLPGTSLRSAMARGAKARIVYSAADAVELARSMGDMEVVFLGVGFETTAPGTAAALADAEEQGLGNFSIYSLLKTCEPAVRALAADPDFNINGFICPGHVAVITGEKGFDFIPQDLGLPAVIAGFGGEDLLRASVMLMNQIRNSEAKLENEYSRIVSREGNMLAREIVYKYFEPADVLWRGLGVISGSGLKLRPEYAFFDAEKRFIIEAGESEPETACRCGDIIKGKLEPAGCPLFGKACLPEDPVGPCMVSSEGACAAAWKYREIV